MRDWLLNSQHSRGCSTHPSSNLSCLKSRPQPTVYQSLLWAYQIQMCSSTQPVAQNEEVPSPQLFRDMVRKQWAQPGEYPNPNGNVGRFYNVATDFAEKLQLPTVDRPAAALTSSNLVSQDTADTLKSEDRRTELSLHRAYQAVTPTTTTSLFKRASLAWLCQMQTRIPPDDQRLQQDISKLAAATEFLADAT